MNKFQASKKDLSLLGAIILDLLILIILFSPRTPFEPISYGILSVFGFIGFWLILPLIFVLSIFLILERKFVNLKSARAVIGGTMIIFALMIIFSSIGNELTIDNAVIKFDQINNNKSGAYLNFKLGGGLAGYFLAGALNSLINEIVTYIICGFIIFGGLIVIFFKYIKKLFVHISKKAKQRKENKTNNDSKAVEIIKENNVETKNETILTKPIFASLSQNNIGSNNNQSGLKKAHFDFPSSVSIKKNDDIDIEKVSSQVCAEKLDTDDIKENNNEEINEPVFEEKASNEFELLPKVEEFLDYVYPPTTLLKYHEDFSKNEINESSCFERTNIINDTLASFKIGANVISHTVGPSVTRFDIKTDVGVSVNSISRYIDDISVNLGGLRVRFESIVYGKSTSGLEIPNQVRMNVGLRESIEKLPTDTKHSRHIPFGKSISGDLISADFADFPHMLVSGTTGSGKTIFMHSTILTLIMRNRPDQLKILLIDPKKVEMNFYQKIPHLLCPNITEARQAYVALVKLVNEMERRYDLFAGNGVNDIKSYNKWASENNQKNLPYICVFVDEFADLMDSYKEVRDPVVRIAQKARAAGIHLVLATQRPSVNVIDGVIKGNIATRVALLSASATDSMTIIGEGGAEKLLGNGDMIIESALLSTSGKPRVQGCFVEPEEINAVCNYLREQYGPQYDPNFLNLDERTVKSDNEPQIIAVDKELNEETQYQQIKEQICQREYCSISFIQRSFAMGFPRAGRIFNRLVKEGIVANEGGDARGSKVLVHVEPQQQIGTIEQSEFIPDDEN